jgi:hypothetical protein
MVLAEQVASVRRSCGDSEEMIVARLAKLHLIAVPLWMRLPKVDLLALWRVKVGGVDARHWTRTRRTEVPGRYTRLEANAPVDRGRRANRLC